MHLCKVPAASCSQQHRCRPLRPRAHHWLRRRGNTSALSSQQQVPTWHGAPSSPARWSALGDASSTSPSLSKRTHRKTTARRKGLTRLGTPNSGHSAQSPRDRHTIRERWDCHYGSSGPLRKRLHTTRQPPVCIFVCSFPNHVFLMTMYIDAVGSRTLRANAVEQVPT